MDPAGNLESYAFGIMRSEIHLGSGSGTTVNFAQSPSISAVKNNMAVAKPLTFWGTELTQHSAVKHGEGELPALSEKEVELERLYAVLAAMSYLANSKAVKKNLDEIPALVPSYNSTPMALAPQ